MISTTVQTISLCLTISVVLGLPQENNRERNKCNLEVPFDFAMLALQWPPGVCYANNKKQCVDYQDTFIIHGNWPSFANGSWPEFCCFQNVFDKRKVSEVEDSLKDKWKTLFVGGTDENFWRHEWKKHGTCAATSPQLKGQRNYFAETLALHGKASIKEWLSRAKIEPQPATSSTTFALKELHRAIESQTGRKVRFECRRLPRRLAPEPLLSGIYLCYDPVTLAYVDCPQPDDIDCGTDKLIYLTQGNAAAAISGQPTRAYAIVFNLLTLFMTLKLFKA